MTLKHQRAVLTLALSAAFVGGPACSSPAGEHAAPTPDPQQAERIAAVLDEVPAGTPTRFILTVSTGADGRPERAYVSTVLARLRDAGAKPEWLEGSPVVFVTCDKRALADAIATGFVAAVQIDRLRKPTM